MANLTLTIPDDKVDIVRDSFAEEFGWTSELGVTKTVFLKAQLIEYVRQVVRNNMGNKAAGTARKSSDDSINSINIT